MVDALAKLPAALRVVAPHLRDHDVDSWYTTLVEPMRSSGIVTVNRAAAFLGQCAVESGGFLTLEENLHYSADRLCAVWPARFVIPTSAQARACAMNPEALANAVYGGRLGNVKQDDGWLFRGGGLIQLTGRANYQRFATAVGLQTAEAAAGYARTPKGAAVSACWFWSTGALNALADAWSITLAGARINGKNPPEGNALRIELCNAARGALL